MAALKSAKKMCELPASLRKIEGIRGKKGLASDR
jgi:hypothetical protein